MKKLLNSALFALIFFFAAHASQQDGSSENAVPGHPSITIEKLEGMSEEEIDELLAEEGIDANEIRAILGGQAPQKDSEDELVKKKLPAALQPHPAPLPDISKNSPLSELVTKEQEKYPIPDYITQRHVLSYTGPEAKSVPEPKDGAIELGEKYDKFLHKYVKGKRPEVIALVCYILYRQASWIYEQYLQEQAKTDAEKKNLMTHTAAGHIAGMMGFNSSLISGADLLIRLSFCGTRLWMDMSDWWRTAKNPYLWMHDPELFMRRFFRNWERAKGFFYDPLYYGTQMKLLSRIMVGLSMPFAWANFFSNNSPGNPMGNPIFQCALQGALRTTASEVSYKAEQLYMRKVSEKKQSSLFQKSGGIIRERLFTDVASWLTYYVSHNYIYPSKKKKEFLPYMGRQVGAYMIRHVYMHFVINALKEVCRRGGLRAVGWVSKKVGSVFSALGFFKRNPADQLHDGIKRLCVNHSLLNDEQDVHEILVYPATIFPGAFCRATQQVITRRELPVVACKDPHFVDHLNTMTEISPYDFLRHFSMNPMFPQQMWAAVDAVKHAVSPSQWQKILRNFLNEMTIDLLFNRERIFCQYLTENVIGWMSAPLLNRINNALLPEA